MASPIAQAIEILAPLSLSDKLEFLTRFTADLVGIKHAPAGKKGRKPKAAEVNAAEKPKRKTAPATYAWLAFPKELQKSHPDLFVGITSMPERLKIVKQYKAEHEEEYEAYKNKFIADMQAGIVPVAADAEEESDQEADAAPVVEEPKPSASMQPVASVQPSAAKEKVAAMKKTLAEKKAASSSNAAAPVSGAAEEEPSTAKPAPKKRSVAKKPAAAAAAAAQPGEGEEFITVDGKNYIMLTENNGCFVRNDNGTFGPWVGVYEKETDTIRKTASPSSV